MLKLIRSSRDGDVKVHAISTIRNLVGSGRPIGNEEEIVQIVLKGLKEEGLRGVQSKSYALEEFTGCLAVMALNGYYNLLLIFFYFCIFFNFHLKSI